MKTSTLNAKCEKCGGALATRIVHEYRNDALIGMPGVVILDAVEEVRCAKCGKVAATGFSNLEGLISAVAVARVGAAPKLSGRDVRFLRKALGWSSKELAAKLEVRDETVSRWENEREPVGPTSEKLLRLIVAEFLAEKAPKLDVDEKRIASMRIRTARTTKAIEMRFRPVLMKIARRREPAWEQVSRAA
ncbi:MAG TPA: helix-turn-helix domain-containing protein [Candidatus Binataceae bacterium]|nr:helix-turn-helix domain-containing protein [Candidatus Binataceae bacterium]